MISLFLVVASIVSYALTIYSIAYWTHWKGELGEVGGVLDYKAFGESTLYHVTIDNQREQRLFSFYDFTSYLTTGAIVFLTINLAILTKDKAEPHKLQYLAGFNLIVAALCFLSYRGTMLTISGRNMLLLYVFPFIMNVGGLHGGHYESSTSLSMFDFTSWMFLFLLFLTLFLTYRSIAMPTRSIGQGYDS